MITNISEFKNEATIQNLKPNGSSGDPLTGTVWSKIETMADKYEAKYLELFFCEEEDPEKEAADLLTYNDLDEDEKTDTALNALIDSIKSPLAYYIAFYYHRDNAARNTGIGSVVLSSENGVRTSELNRGSIIWNDMVDMTKKAYKSYYELTESTICYPKNDIFKTINSLNI